MKIKKFKDFTIESANNIIVEPENKYKILDTINIFINQLNQYIGKFDQESINNMVDNIKEELDKLKIIDDVNKYNL